MCLCLGIVPWCCCWPREDDATGAGIQHQPGHQLPGLTAEEELAERPCSLHQEFHGKTTTYLLSIVH